MGIILELLIAQWIILLVWIIVSKLEENDEWLPSFYQALSMILLPFSVVVILLLYLKKVESKNKKQ